MLYVWLLQLRIPFDFLLTSLLLLYRRRWARGHTFSRCYTIYFKLFSLKHICMHVWLNGTKLLNTFYLTIIIIITIILTQTYTKYYMAFCHCAVHIRLISLKKKEFPHTRTHLILICAPVSAKDMMVIYIARIHIAGRLVSFIYSRWSPFIEDYIGS